MDSGQRRRSARTGREGQADVRHGRYVADLAADARRGACDGREQCVAYDAFNIHTLQWDEELLELFGHSGFDDARGEIVERSVRSDQDHDFSRTRCPSRELRATSRRPLFGQMCVEPGSVKNTYGTGCFLLMNSGEKPIASANNLLTTIAWKIGDKVDYAPRREHLRRRLGRTVAARRAGDHPLVVGNRRAGGVGARHQRRLFRARADGACGPVLGPVCAGAR